MSLVLYGLGIIINGIVAALPDFAVSLSASIVHDNAKKIYNSITIQKGRGLHTLHPVIESALVSSFYNAIILSLTKTRDYYKRTSRDTYKKEILQISARINDLTKLLKGQASSGYAMLLDSFCEVISNNTVDNANRLITIAKNNLIGLPEKTRSDLEGSFIGIFLVLFKEKYASDEVLKSILNFDMLQTTLSMSIDTNKKIESLIYANINIESELSNISSAVLSLPTYDDHTELRTMLISIQQTLTRLAQSEIGEIPSDILLQQSYLDVIYGKYKYVEFPSFDGVKRRTNVKDIYVPLELINRIAVTIDTNGQVTKMSILEIDEYNEANSSKNPFLIEKMSVFDVLPRNPKAFIIGDSGAGKTITAQHLLCCLSGHQSTDSDYWNEERLKFGFNDFDEIPIYISFQEYFSYGKFGRGANSVLEYLQSEFCLQENLIKFLKTKLLKGKVVLIFKDCVFSEVPASIVLSDIADFINNYSRCRCVIFRSTGNDDFYNQYSVFEDIPKFELAKLSIKTMRLMADKYYSILSEFSDVGSFSFERFWETIKKMGLQALAETPYWFGYLLLMNATLEELPDNSFSIHTKIIDNMLNRLLSSLENFSEADKQNTFLAFELLAVKMFCSIAEGSIISKILMQEILEKYLPSEKALLLMRKIKSNECKLIIYTSENEISYAHKSLISALATRYYRHHIELISTLVDCTIKTPSIWIESLILMFDEKNYNLLAFVLFMLQNAFEADKNVIAKISLSILSKINIRNFSVRPERTILVKWVLDMGKDMIDSGNLPIVDRISISQNLSLISVGCDFSIDVNLYFNKIPSGVVILGNDNLTHGEPYEYDITYDYYAAKFPVTNFDYQQFLLENLQHPLPLDEASIWDTNTRYVDKRFLNHPVVGVSFHDAIKYCQWLNTKIVVPQGYRVWLPSDPEWMKMYRGGKEVDGMSNEIPDRIYPWGNEWIEGYANLPKLKVPIYSTTAVGIFVEGISKYGCYDSCGNVLEWTTTSWGGTNPDVPEYQHPYTPSDGREDLELPGLRITRGGSFLFSEGDAKCSCRLDPISKFPDTGFRVFLVPDSNKL